MLRMRQWPQVSSAVHCNGCYVSILSIRNLSGFESLILVLLQDLLVIGSNAPQTRATPAQRRPALHPLARLMWHQFEAAMRRCSVRGCSALPCARDGDERRHARGVAVAPPAALRRVHRDAPELAKQGRAPRKAAHGASRGNEPGLRGKTLGVDLDRAVDSTGATWALMRRTGPAKAVKPGLGGA
jgi:hypothetical protein